MYWRAMPGTAWYDYSKLTRTSYKGFFRLHQFCWKGLLFSKSHHYSICRISWNIVQRNFINNLEKKLWLFLIHLNICIPTFFWDRYLVIPIYNVEINAHTNWYSKSKKAITIKYLYKSIKDWNKLPEHITNSTSTEIFRERLTHDFLLKTFPDLI